MFMECPDPDECVNMHELTEAYDTLKESYKELKRRICLLDKEFDRCEKSTMYADMENLYNFVKEQIKEMAKE